MLDVVTLMLPIFIMIGIGAAFLRFGWFPSEGLPILNRFVMNACIPVLMFSAVTGGASLRDFAFGNAALYAAASLTGAVCLWLVLRLVLREALSQSLILSLGAGTANSVFLGFPIALMVIPDRAASVVAWVVLAEILFIIPIITTLALWAEQRGDRLSLRAILLPLAKSPVTAGLVSGFAFLALGLTMPAPIQKVIDSILSAAPFIALFLIGGMMVEGRITRSGPRVLAITLAKLVLHPLLVGTAFALVFGWQSAVARDALLFASVPIFLTYVVFCSRHEVGEVAASAVVLSTLAGAVTVTALLTWVILP